jgi:hypothetical protein
MHQQCEQINADHQIDSEETMGVSSWILADISRACLVFLTAGT